MSWWDRDTIANAIVINFIKIIWIIWNIFYLKINLSKNIIIKFYHHLILYLRCYTQYPFLCSCPSWITMLHLLAKSLPYHQSIHPLHQFYVFYSLGSLFVLLMTRFVPSRLHFIHFTSRQRRSARNTLECWGAINRWSTGITLRWLLIWNDQLALAFWTSTLDLF